MVSDLLMKLREEQDSPFKAASPEELKTRKPKRETFDDLALQFEMSPETSRIYVAYMRERWPNKEGREMGYAEEWAERFAGGNEYGQSDLRGQAVLKRLAPDRYPSRSEIGKSREDRLEDE